MSGGPDPLRCLRMSLPMVRFLAAIMFSYLTDRRVSAPSRIEHERC